VHETLLDGGTVSGTVTDGAGHPLSNVLVHVTHSAADDFDNLFFPDDPDISPFTDGPNVESLTRTDGSYTIRGVQPGSSVVCADASAARGPDAAGYFDQCLGGSVGSTKAGTAITVTADANRAGTDLGLSPAAGIGGTASAPAGRGAASGQALLYAGHTRKYLDFHYLDGDGGYAFTQLRPGDYRVCIDPNGLERQCYQDVAWPSGGPPLDAATVVTAPAGTLTGGIDFHLHS
jgi:hypothetical protein